MVNFSSEVLINDTGAVLYSSNTSKKSTLVLVQVNGASQQSVTEKNSALTL